MKYRKLAFSFLILLLLSFPTPFTTAAGNQTAEQTEETASVQDGGVNGPAEEDAFTGVIQDEGDYVIIPDEPIPAASADMGGKELPAVSEATPISDTLPQTGGIPGAVFGGAGGFLAALGIIMNRLKKKNVI